MSESSSREMDTHYSSLIYKDIDEEVENSSDCDQMSEDLYCNSDYDDEQLSDNSEDDQLAKRDSNSYKNHKEVQRSIMKNMSWNYIL